MNSAGRPRPRWQRTLKNHVFTGLCFLAISVSGIALAVLLTSIVRQGNTRIDDIDREAVAEARADQTPDSVADLGKVDWSAEADARNLPALRQLAAIRWSTVAKQYDLEYADDIDRVDWSGVDGIADPAALDDADLRAIVLESKVEGAGWLAGTWQGSEFGQFVTSPPSRRPERAGIGPALLGTVWICAVCCLFALPLGVGTAIYLEEYRPQRGWLRKVHAFIQLNITNLAGVPSIVYGIIGLSAFVQMFGLAGLASEPLFTIGTTDDWYYFQVPFGRSVLAGGLTLMLVILPIVIISSQEALRAVPDSLRQAALALGSTRWQTIRRMTLPSAIPGIMTGAILAMSRAIGEAAPILIICGIVFIRFTPQHVMDDFTALPLQIYDWAGRPQEDFHKVAAAGILVLLAVLMGFNAVAVAVRIKFQKQLQS